MAWERRRGGRYYYTKRREGRRVVSEYVRNGYGTADCIAELTELRKQEREGEARLRRMERRKDRDIDHELDEIVRQAQETAAEYLRSLGYHQHKRQWRLQRGQANQ